MIMETRNTPEAAERRVKTARRACESARRRYVRLGCPVGLLGLVVATLPVTGPLGLVLVLAGIAAVVVAGKYAFEYADAKTNVQALEALPSMGAAALAAADQAQGTSQIVDLPRWRELRGDGQPRPTLAHT